MSETPHIKNIFSAEEEDCLSLEQMVAYRDGKLLPEEKHYADRHLLNCVLCEMGYEGILEEGAEVVEAGAAAIAEAAWSRVEVQEKKRRRGAWVWISAAASVVLLIAVGLIFLKGPSDETMEKVAQQYYKQPTAPPVAGNERSEAETGSVDPNSSTVDGKDGGFAANQNLKNQQEGVEDLMSKLRNQGPFNESLADMEEMSAPITATNKDMENMHQYEDAVDAPTQENRAGNMGYKYTTVDSSSPDLNITPFNTPGTTFASGEIAKAKKDVSMDKGEVDMALDDFDVEAEEPEEQKEMVELDEIQITAQSHQRDLDQVTTASVIVRQDDARDVSLSKTASRKGKKYNRQKNKEKARSAGRSKKAETKSGKTAMEQSAPTEKMESVEEEVANDFAGEELSDTKSSVDAGGEVVLKDPYNRGMDFYRSGQFAKSATLLREASAATPSNLQAHYYAAASFLNLEQPEAAQYHLERILALPGNSLYADAEWYMAITHLKLRDRSKAKELLEKISQNNGKYSGQAKEALKDL